MLPSQNPKQGYLQNNYQVNGQGLTGDKEIQGNNIRYLPHIMTSYSQIFNNNGNVQQNSQLGQTKVSNPSTQFFSFDVNLNYKSNRSIKKIQQEQLELMQRSVSQNDIREVPQF